jgi:hypothetical protein
MAPSPTSSLDGFVKEEVKRLEALLEALSPKLSPYAKPGTGLPKPHVAGSPVFL